jgi:hypothetical protein
MQIAQTIDIGREALRQDLPGSTGYSVDNPGGGFGDILSTILSGVMAIAALMLLLYLIWGGIEWITSGGDKAKTEKARNRMTQGVIGIVVLAATLAIFTMVQSFLGLSLLNFGATGRPELGSGQICASDTCICGDNLVINGVRCVIE